MNEEINSYENITPSFKNPEELYRREKPKVSLIIPVYNQERFVNKIYAVIEQQSLKDIEIIFIDDFSQDNSSQIIAELMKKDKRIVYLRNNDNKGALYSRNRGGIHARGEYVMLVDIDDYILNDILIKNYETAKKYDLDVLQFYAMAGDLKKNIIWSVLKYGSGIIRGDEVKNVYFHGITRNTWDKFIKREVFVKAIEFMKEKYRDINYVVFNDDITIFCLFKVAKSFGFLEEIGYIYNWDVADSATHKYEDPESMNDIFKTCVSAFEFLYEQTENNEKGSAFSFFAGKCQGVCLKGIKHLTRGFDYIIKVLDSIIDGPHYGEGRKNTLRNFKNKVIEQKNSLNKKNNS